MFQFDWGIDRQTDGSFKKYEVIRNIKKLFNFECNNYVTLVKGQRYDVVLVRDGSQKAYQCEMLNDRLRIVKELDININDTLKKLKNGRRITG